MLIDVAPHPALSPEAVERVLRASRPALSPEALERVLRASRPSLSPEEVERILVGIPVCQPSL